MEDWRQSSGLGADLNGETFSKLMWNCGVAPACLSARAVNSHLITMLSFAALDFVFPTEALGS